MARACVLNIWDRGRLLLEKLRAEGRIVSIEPVAGQPLYCFEFTGVLEIDLQDYIEVSPPHTYQNETMLEMLREQFKKAVVLTVASTLRNGVIEEFTETHITIRDTEKTEIVAFRVSREEKRRLEEEAEKQGLTLSDYIRSKLFPQA